MAVACCLGVTTAQAAPIDYGDFSGATVMYLDVTETANAPVDAEPLFGAPTILGDSLDFDPKGFSAQSSGAASVLTDGQLNFDVMGIGAAINSLSFGEAGDFTLVGGGSAATNVSYSLSLASIEVLAIDGVDLGSAVSLGGAVVSGQRDLVSDGQGAGLWSLSLGYDVDAALTNAGLEYEFGATKLRIALDDTLTASSELVAREFGEGLTSQFATAAFIAKKDFFIDGATTPVPVPEPSLLFLSFGVAWGVGSLRRSLRS